MTLISAISDLRYILEIVLKESVNIFKTTFITAVFNGLLVEQFVTCEFLLWKQIELCIIVVKMIGNAVLPYNCSLTKFLLLLLKSNLSISDTSLAHIIHDVRVIVLHKYFLNRAVSSSKLYLRVLIILIVILVMIGIKWIIQMLWYLWNVW